MATRIWLLICLAIILFAYSTASAKVSGHEVEYRVGEADKMIPPEQVAAFKEIFSK